MKDKSRRSVTHIVIGTLDKGCSGYGTVSPAEVIKIERYATERIITQVQTDLLKAEP
jgi:hypothetical protein